MMLFGNHAFQYTFISHTFLLKLMLKFMFREMFFFSGRLLGLLFLEQGGMRAIVADWGKIIYRTQFYVLQRPFFHILLRPILFPCNASFWNNIVYYVLISWLLCRHYITAGIAVCSIFVFISVRTIIKSTDVFLCLLLWSLRSIISCVHWQPHPYHIQSLTCNVWKNTEFLSETGFILSAAYGEDL